MNGQQPARMAFELSIEVAENISKVVYNLSEQCFMAHTLRAVEAYILREYRKPYPILLKVEKGVRTRFKSKSWALVTNSTGYIFVEDDLSNDQKRVCIAHEGYHILEFFRPVKSDQAKIERVCDEFANQLCKMHNEFYCDPAKVNKCKFNSLPINAERG